MLMAYSQDGWDFVQNEGILYNIQVIVIVITITYAAKGAVLLHNYESEK